MKKLERLGGGNASLHWMVTCNLLAGLTCATKLVLLECDILHAGHHPFLDQLLELAHSNVCDALVPKPTQGRLGEEACCG